MSVNYQAVHIRSARVEDAMILFQAQHRISLEPGQLVSAPHELKDLAFREKIRILADHPRGVYMVAELGTEPIAHGYLDPFHLEAIQHVAHLTIAVHPGHQGKGIGEKLLVAMIEWSRSRSLLEKIELHVRSTNSRAIALYTKVGFKEEGRWLRRIKLADDLYIDDVMMGLWL